MKSSSFGWNAPPKIKLIRELTILLTPSNSLHILVQKLLKSMINCVNQRYIQYLDENIQRLREYMRLNLWAD